LGVNFASIAKENKRERGVKEREREREEMKRKKKKA